MQATTSSRGPERRTRRRRLAGVLAAAWAVLFGLDSAWALIGLSTQFVDVAFENMKIGETYNIREIAGVPYTVKNRGDGTAIVMVEPQIPEAKQVKAPYEPIPDASWLTLSPGQLTIGPEAMGFSDIIIKLPDDKELVGRHFQVELWAHTINTGLLAAGVKTRLRFSVGPGPETLEKEARERAMVTLNYDLWPTALYVKKAKAGKPYDVKAEEKRSFKLTNRNEEPLELVLKPIPWPRGSVRVPKGYEYIKDVSWVKFEPETVSVEGFTVADVRMILDPPEKLKGRKVAFIVGLHLPIGTMVSAVHQALVTIEE